MSGIPDRVVVAHLIAERIEEASEIRSQPMRLDAHTLNIDAVIASVREAGRVAGMRQAAELVIREFAND